MFHNYFFLKRLVESLQGELEGLTLGECFSQNKDELILQFANPSKEFIIRANLDPVISLLSFPESFARAGKNSVDLFQELIGKEVESVRAFKFERSLEIVFLGNESLIFKMHARRANILYFDGVLVQRIFRKNLNQDLEIKPKELNRSIEISEESFASIENEPLHLIPALGKEVKVFLERSGFHELDQSKKWVTFKALMSDLDSNPIWLIGSSQPRISLIEPSASSTIDPIVACNWLYDASVRTLFFEKEKKQLINQLKQKIKKSESYILKNKQKLSEMEMTRNPEEIANVLMANLHNIQQGLSKIVLTDFYTNQPITIKLNTTLSPQKNAEIYYRKAKNRAKELKALEENIKVKVDLIDTLSKQILTIDEISIT